MLSFIFRLLTRARKRDEVTQDIIGTSEEGVAGLVLGAAVLPASAGSGWD